MGRFVALSGQNVLCAGGGARARPEASSALLLESGESSSS